LEKIVVSWLKILECDDCVERSRPIQNGKNVNVRQD